MSDLSLEAEVTPSDLFQIMANMLREAESAMTRGTAAATASMGSDDRTGHRAASTPPSSSSEIRPTDCDRGRLDCDSIHKAADQEGRDIAASSKYSSSRSILQRELSSDGLMTGVDWGQVLAGPSGLSNPVTEQGRLWIQEMTVKGSDVEC